MNGVELAAKAGQTKACIEAQEKINPRQGCSQVGIHRTLYRQRRASTNGKGTTKEGPQIFGRIGKPALVTEATKLAKSA